MTPMTTPSPSAPQEVPQINPFDPKTGQATADMINAFLRWQLPESVSSDGCATRPGKGRTGTNLLAVYEAMAMIQEVVCPIIAKYQQPALDAAREEVDRLRAQLALDHAPHDHDHLPTQAELMAQLAAHQSWGERAREAMKGAMQENERLKGERDQLVMERDHFHDEADQLRDWGAKAREAADLLLAGYEGLGGDPENNGPRIMREVLATHPEAKEGERP